MGITYLINHSFTKIDSMKYKNDFSIVQRFETANETGLKEVNGTLIKFDEAPSHLFFAHAQSVISDEVEDDPIETEVYFISEVSTGMSVTGNIGRATPETAITVAKRRLANCDFSDVLDGAKNVLVSYKISFPVNEKAK